MIGRSPANASCDSCRDAVARHVGQFLIHEKRRISVAFANETVVQPLFGDALKLSEKMKLGRFTRIAPFRIKQALRHVEEKRRGPHVAEVFQAEINPFADDAWFRVIDGPTKSGLNSRIESSLNSAVRRSSGNSTR